VKRLMKKWEKECRQKVIIFNKIKNNKDGMD
jgi:hypothetical protein